LLGENPLKAHNARFLAEKEPKMVEKRAATTNLPRLSNYHISIRGKATRLIAVYESHFCKSDRMVNAPEIDGDGKSLKKCRNRSEPAFK